MGRRRKSHIKKRLMRRKRSHTGRRRKKNLTKKSLMRRKKSPIKRKHMRKKNPMKRKSLLQKRRREDQITTEYLSISYKFWQHKHNNFGDGFLFMFLIFNHRFHSFGGG